MKNNTRNIATIIIVIVFVVCAGLLFFNYRNSIVENSTSTNQSPQESTMSIKDVKITDNTKPFAIDITYPSITGTGFDDVNKKVQDIINKELSTFKSNSLANDQAVKDTDPQDYAKYPREYDLKISYQKGEVSQTTISFVFDIYNFEGGAHGASYFIPLNYDVKNQKELSLADVFAGQANYLQKISQYCSKDLAAQITKGAGNTQGTWIGDGAGPKAENFSTFLLNPHSITFYFAQYQVAPYSYGSYQVTMPR